MSQSSSNLASCDPAVEAWLGELPSRGEPARSSIDVLSRFLQGFQLENVVAEEPFWAVYDGAVLHEAIRPLTRATVALLDRWLAGAWKPSAAAKAHYNLLHLCIELHDGEALGDGIWTLFDRQLISGHYKTDESVPMARPLLGAMIRNQPDDMRPPMLWHSLMRGEFHDSIPDAGPVEGFRGFVASREVLQSVDREAKIASVLQVFLDHIGGSFESRTNIYNREVRQLSRFYPGLDLYRVRINASPGVLTDVLDERFDGCIRKTLSEIEEEENAALRTRWKQLGSKVKDRYHEETEKQRPGNALQAENLFRIVLRQSELGRSNKDSDRTLVRNLWEPSLIPELKRREIDAETVSA